VKRAGPEVTARPEDFRAALGETLVPRRAGARLNRMQVVAATPETNKTVLQSKWRGRKMGLDSVARNCTKSWLKKVATQTPRIAPAKASRTP